MTKILPCSCKHKMQDQLHGQGKRVHNFAPKSKGWRCTVCKSIKPE